MDLNNFMEIVRDNMQTIVGDKANVEIKEVGKNNGKVYHGLMVSEPGVNCSPSMYLDEMFEQYKRGRSIEDIMEQLNLIYRESRCNRNIDVSFYTDYEKVCVKILPKLINYSRNKEMLAKLPHRVIEDLAVVYYCEVKDENIGNGLIMVKNEHMEAWGVDEERLYNDSFKNAGRLNPVKLNTLADTVSEMTGIEQEELPEDLNMLVLTNKNNLFGATTLLYDDVLQNIADRLDSDLYILPSSIHETIILSSGNDYDPDQIMQLKYMVEQVNAENVAQEDYLSDNVYYYNRNKGRLCMALS
ncbi:MAG: DUF5688 family protein [Butyrivibrio sp.]|nr:DUF5688 family protein [Butyrivibrio sp.]